MQKLLLILISMGVFQSMIIAQTCDPIFSLDENFDNIAASTTPPCWTFPASGVSVNSAGELSMDSQLASGADYVIMPEFLNLEGELAFTVYSDFFISSGRINVWASDGVAGGNWDLIRIITLDGTFGGTVLTETVDFRNYSGTNTFIALQFPGDPFTSNRPLKFDNFSFTATCPSNPPFYARTQDVVVTLDDSGNGSITPEMIDAGSGVVCGSATAPTLSLDRTQFTCADLGDNTVTLTATEGGDTDTQTATVTVLPFEVKDQSEPYITYLDNSGSVLVSAIIPNPCSNASYTFEQIGGGSPYTSFDCTDAGTTITGELVVDLGGGQSRTSRVLIEIRDTISPTVVGQNITVQLDNTGAVTVDPATVDNGTSDNCSVTLSLSKDSFTFGDVGVNSVWLIAADDSGNADSVQVNVTVESGFASFNATTSTAGSQCLDGMTSFDVTLSGSESGGDYFLIDTLDNAVIDGPVSGTGNALLFNTGVLGETRTFEVARLASGIPAGSGSALTFNGNGAFAEGNGNWRFNYSRGYTFEATIQGNTNPTTLHNPLFSIGNTGDSDIEAYFQNGTGYLVVLHERNGSSNFERYQAPANNTKTHIAIVFAPNGSRILSVYYDGVLQTNVDGNLSSNIGVSSSYTFKLGEINHVDFGTTSLSDLIIDEVRVWDAPRTAATIQSLMNTCVDPTSQGLMHYYQLDEATGTTATDLSGSLDLTLQDTDANFSNWQAEGSGLLTCPVDFYVPVSNTVTIGDFNAPTLSLASSFNLDLDATGNATVNLADLVSAASDNCSDSTALVFTADITSFSCDDLGANPIIVTVADESGNETTVTGSVTVQDVSAPVISNSNQTPLEFELDATTNEVVLTIADLRSDVVDNCDANPTITLDKSTFTCADLGTQTITITATDSEGNQSTATEDVVIVDRIVPTFTVLNPTVELDANGSYVIQQSDIVSDLADNCSSVNDITVAFDDTPFSCSNLGTFSFSFTVTDGNSNTANATSTVLVVDRIAPIAIAQDITVELDQNGRVAISPSQVDNGSSDNCNVTVSLDKTSFTTDDIGDNVVTLTAVDDSFNQSTATATVTVKAARTPQTITFPQPSDAVYGDSPVSLNATASSGLPVTYAVLSGPGTILNDRNGVQLGITGAGDVIIEATQAGDDSFAPASGSTALAVTKATLTATAEDVTIKFGSNSILSFSITYTGFVNGDDALDIDQVPTASSSATSGSDAGVYDIVVTGGSDNDYNLNNVNGVFTIEKADQVITFPQVNDVDLATTSSVFLSATSDVGLPIQYSIVEGGDFTTISGTELVFSGTGSVTVEASQVGNSNYNAAATVSQSFVVIDSRKQDQTITFSSLSNVTYGDAPISLSATSTSGLAVTYSIVSGDDASISGNILTVLGAGTVEIEARQDGNDGFNAATPVVQTLVIDAARVTITPDDKEIILGDALPIFTITYSGFVNGEDESALDMLPVVSSPTADIATEGEYDILVTQDAIAVNYVFTNDTGTLRVVRPLSVLNEEHIVFYPNPVVGVLSISGLLESAAYEIISLDGKVVDAGYTTEQINLSDIKKGTYVLQLKDANQYVIRREVLIKK